MAYEDSPKKWVACSKHSWAENQFIAASTRHATAFGFDNGRRKTAYHLCKKGSNNIHNAEGVSVCIKLMTTCHKKLEMGENYDCYN